ncbi:MAG: hypothetical protein ACQEQL_07890 [Pseudomonadota bacterium]
MADPHSNKITLTEKALDVLQTAAWLQKELAKKGLHNVQHYTPQKGKSFFEARNEKGRFVPVQQLKETLAEIVAGPEAEKSATLLSQFSDARQDADKKQQEENIAAENEIADAQRREDERKERRLAEEHAASAAKSTDDEESSAAPEFNARNTNDAESEDDNDHDTESGLSISADLPDENTPGQDYDSQPDAADPAGYQMTEDRQRMVSRLAGYSGGSRSPQDVEQALGADFFHRLQEDGRGVTFSSDTSMDIHYKDGCCLNVKAKKGKLYVTLPKGQKLTEDIARDMVRIQKARGAETITLERKNASLDQRALLFAAAQAEGMNVTDNSFTPAELQELFGVEDGPSVNDTENQEFSALMNTVNQVVADSEDSLLVAKATILFMSMIDGESMRPQLSIEQTRQIHDIFEQQGVTSDALDQAFDVIQPIDQQSLQAAFDTAIEDNIEKDPDNAARWQAYRDQINGLKLEKLLLHQPALLAQSGQIEPAEQILGFLTKVKSGNFETPATAARKEQSGPDQADNSTVDDLADYGKAAPDDAAKPKAPRAKPPRNGGR